jgi:predicted DNA-binding transcriptional regulator AlpA
MKDLVPLKAVAEDLCVSKSTLWRARQSNLPGFPEPTIIRRQVFWKRSELDALEDALLQFKGRSVFEEHRAHARKVAALTKKRPALRRKPRSPKRGPSSQQELF